MTPAEIEYRRVVALRQKRLKQPARDIGGCRMGGVVVRFERRVALSLVVPTARCAPPRHRCRKGNQVPTMADRRWLVRMPIG